MIIFLYGTDGYRLKQNKDVVIGKYSEKHSSGVNLMHFDLSDQSTDAIGDFIKINSFFVEPKLAVIKNVFEKKDTADAISELIKKYDIENVKDASFLIVENKAEKSMSAKSKQLFKLLSDKKNVVKDFELLVGKRLEVWVTKETESRGSTIEASALKELVALFGNDSWALINEIDKLSNYKKNGLITKNDVSLLASSSLNLNIFDLVDALTGRDRARAFELLYQETKTGRDPHYILAMIIYQFRNLLTLKDLSLRNIPKELVIKKSGIHPFAARKMYKHLDTFSVEYLKDKYRDLLEIDISFKEGRKGVENSLYEFILT